MEPKPVGVGDRIQARMRRRTQLPAHSPGRAALENALSRLNRQILTEQPVCAYCRKNPATTVHHRAGRGRLLLFRPLMVGLCFHCHRYVDTHRATVEPRGWFVRLRTQAQIDAVLEMTADEVAKTWPLKYR